jgi:hypothetical protein
MRKGNERYARDGKRIEDSRQDGEYCEHQNGIRELA